MTTKCPHCGEEHPWIPHPSRIDRVILRCPRRGHKAVMETWAETSVALERLPLTESQVDKLRTFGYRSSQDLIPALTHLDEKQQLLAIPGIGPKTIYKLEQELLDVHKVHILVTGTGRCGTRYVAKLLSSAGVPCGHEGVFTPRGISKAYEILEKISSCAESSWMAAPFIGYQEVCGARIVHLIRHPIRVINSLLGMRFFAADSRYLTWANYAISHLPSIGSLDSEEDRTVAFYVRWNEMIETELPMSGFTHRIEDDDLSLLYKLGIDPTGHTLFSDKTDNTRPPAGNIDLNTVRSDIVDRLLEMAERYDYEIAI